MNQLSISRNMRTAVMLLVEFIVVTGLLYPLVMVGIGGIFDGKARGSLVYVGGKPVGSSLIGQKFDRAEYFHPRPSATDYDASNSGASNLGPTNSELMRDVKDRVRALNSNGLNSRKVPVDLVTSSASGLDPDISPASAFAQAGRVASARKIPVSQINSLINSEVIGGQLGFLGEKRVNVLSLNLELDRRFPLKK